MPSSNESRRNPLRGIGDKPVLSQVEGTCWTKPLSRLYRLAMDIVKGQERWGRVVRMSSHKQENRSRVVAHEFRDTDEAVEAVNKPAEGTPPRSRRLDSCEIGEAKQFFMRSPMSGAWVVRPQLGHYRSDAYFPFRARGPKGSGWKGASLS